MAKTLVVVPVYNEAATIALVLEKLCQYYGGDVLIVDDGSTDGSLDRIVPCSRYSLAVLSHSQNQGYGTSLIDGFRYAAEHCYEAVISMDCDAQHEPEQVPDFLHAVADCDMVSGSRYLQPSPEDDPAPEDRFRINRIVTERIRAVTGFEITDAFCGFKAYRVAALARLQLSEPGYAFPLQFWIQAAVQGFRVKEIPVTRIYTHLERSFGVDLDQPEFRLAYYENVIAREAEKWKLI